MTIDGSGHTCKEMYGCPCLPIFEAVRLEVTCCSCPALRGMTTEDSPPPPGEVPNPSTPDPRHDSTS
jgi:hypothetical protein